MALITAGALLVGVAGGAALGGSLGGENTSEDEQIIINDFLNQTTTNINGVLLYISSCLPFLRFSGCS